MIRYLNSHLGVKIKVVIEGEKKKHQLFLLVRNEGVFGHLPSLSTQNTILHHKVLICMHMDTQISKFYSNTLQ